jgi:hypothetical protein
MLRNAILISPADFLKATYYKKQLNSDFMLLALELYAGGCNLVFANL